MRKITIAFLVLSLLFASSNGLTQDKIKYITNSPVSWSENTKNESSSHFNELLQDEDRVTVEKWCYPGGDMKPAEMIFWSNGLLEIRSEIFDEQKQSRFFSWEFLTPNSLRIKFFKDNWDIAKLIEQNHPDHIWSIDKKSQSIFYRVFSNSKIFFLNWGFTNDFC